MTKSTNRTFEMVHFMGGSKLIDKLQERE